MADELVQLRLSPIFRDFGERIEKLRDSILRGAQPIVRREWALSVRARWFRTGATLQSALDEFVTIEGRKVYRLFPTAVSERGAPYPLFGEYGTGRKGAASGRPAPRGYRYGPQVGMTARRFGRKALEAARPQIEVSAQRRVKRFAQNATVS